MHHVNLRTENTRNIMETAQLDCTFCAGTNSLFISVASKLLNHFYDLCVASQLLYHF